MAQPTGGIKRTTSNSPKDSRRSPSRGYDSAEKFDMISRAPPLPPPPVRLGAARDSSSGSSTNESSVREPSPMLSPDSTRSFAKPPGPNRKKVTHSDSSQVLDPAALTFPKKSQSSAAPPPVPPKTRRRTSTKTHPADDSDSFGIYEQEEKEAMAVPVARSGHRDQSYTQQHRVKPLPAISRPRHDEHSSILRSDSSKHLDDDSVGLEIPDPMPLRPALRMAPVDERDQSRKPSTIEPYGAAETIHVRDEKQFPVRPPVATHPSHSQPIDSTYPWLNGSSAKLKRTLPCGTFMMELGALLVVFIISMVLVLAIREEQATLRTVMQAVYCYIYAASIVWMIWCTVDISRFRRQWLKFTYQNDHEDYMSIVERNTHKLFYYPNVHNTGGLFMRAGAGVLCMGSLLLTAIEAAKSIGSIGNQATGRSAASVNNDTTVLTTKAILHILRFLFHCVQFLFLFRYGNIIINRYLSLAQIGLINVIIANFCTWFEAIVFETLEQIHKDTASQTTAAIATVMTTTSLANASESFQTFFRSGSAEKNGGNATIGAALEWIEKMEEILSPYLYPCLIEYSLISLTVFFIMWRNIGKKQGNSYLRFRDRHIFTVNCARASRGLLFGGMVLIVTILTLIPIYVLDNGAQKVTQITELVLLIMSLMLVTTALIHTTRLHYDPHAHVDVFDQILIIITTIGDFAYAMFGLFASIFIDRNSLFEAPFVRIEIAVGVFSILQTFLQTGFILDTLKRRTQTKEHVRSKPGRESVTALLLTNLAIWLHDSLSAKKVRLNPFQVNYYNPGTWAIIQAFTSPLSIFYRFHSSVCLADIWQEAYDDHDAQDRSRMTGKQGMQSYTRGGDGTEFHHL